MYNSNNNNNSVNYAAARIAELMYKQHQNKHFNNNVNDNALSPSSTSSTAVIAAAAVAASSNPPMSHMTESEVKRIFSMSKSRGNFAALLVQQMYGRQDRIQSNVMGTRGKRQLSPKRMQIVKNLAFKMYPAENEKELELFWKKECVKAIDSKNRKVFII
jgi:mevalonate pyrophosphate decarboxylase